MLDAICLWRRRDEYSTETYASRRSRITSRLDALITDDWANKNATRLVRRLRKYRDHLFTFLDLPYVPFENNFAEREIRPAVIMRKNSYCKPQRQRGGHASNSHDSIPHSQTAWSESRRHDGTSPAAIQSHRQATALAERKDVNSTEVLQ